MNERYGVKTKNGTVWFFLLEDAKKFANGDHVIYGIFHNDEGCTPWIETIEQEVK